MCRSMTTDSISDRQGKNFCEEWIAKKNKKPHSDADKNKEDKFASLFGD